MAKPIPPNRRWLQNQQARAEAQASTPVPAPAPASAPEAARSVDDLIRELAADPHDADADLIALVEAYLDDEPQESARVIHARFASQCRGCGRSIRVGERITRHATWGVWVHEGCRNSQRRALRTITASYSGVCRYCRRAIAAGERISQHNRYGWIHEACAQQLQDQS